MNYSTSVYSLDGNDIYSVALAFERMGIREMAQGTQQTMFQGQDMEENNRR